MFLISPLRAAHVSIYLVLCNALSGLKQSTYKWQWGQIFNLDNSISTMSNRAYVKFRGSEFHTRNARGQIFNLDNSISTMSNRAYVQFRGSEFHTRNARSRQLQEQRRAKAHSRQAKQTRKEPRSHALRGNASWTLCVLCIGRPRYEHRGRRASHMHSHAERGNEWVCLA